MIDKNGRERDALLQAIAALQVETQRLHTLEAARQRAREESWHIATRLQEARQALEFAKADAPRALAYQFANGDTDTISAPLEAAEREVDRCTAEERRIVQIGDALDHELRQVTSRLNHAQTRVHEALALVVCNSDEFKNLIAAHRKAWFTLRSIKEALRVIRRSLGGHIFHEFDTEPEIAEPLSPRIGYPVDEKLVEGWRESLARLAEDPDADLPTAR
jgi:hypothetical protein